MLARSTAGNGTNGWPLRGTARRYYAGEGWVRAKHARVEHGALETGSLPRHETSAEQGATQSASGILMALVVGLFAGSALISLTLLWLAIRGIQWLLQG